MNVKILQRGERALKQQREGGRDRRSFILSLMLSIVFTVGLTFTTVLLPLQLHQLLISHEIGVGFSWHAPLLIWIIGFAAFFAILVLIILGFLLDRRNVALSGTLLAYLPTFHYFSMTMYFLVGIGWLKLLWLPLLYPFPKFSPMKLGLIVYLPQLELAMIFSLVGEFSTGVVILCTWGASFVIIGAGILIFLLGTQAWLYGKVKGKELIDFGIYRYSRHPQYLGYLLWSYGVMSLSSYFLGGMGYYNPGGGLVWILSSLLIICIALREEIETNDTHGEEYKAYRKQTPFFLPFPRVLRVVITAPVQLLLEKTFPESKRETTYIFGLYFVIALLLSLPLFIMDLGSSYYPLLPP